MSIAASLGLTADDAVVLHDSNKLTLRLLPCDVLARVAPVAQQAARFEIELAQRLAGAGCPVAVLEPRVEPRAYERDGFVVTVWTYYEPATHRDLSPADYADALERLHAGMRTLDVPTPHFTDRDLETCCRGPFEFDLAHAPHEVSDHYLGVDPALLRQCRILVLAMITTWRWDRDDQLPGGRRLGTEWLGQIRAALGRNRLASTTDRGSTISPDRRVRSRPKK
jgi:hypothetical protein